VEEGSQTSRICSNRRRTLNRELFEKALVFGIALGQDSEEDKIVKKEFGDKVLFEISIDELLEDE